MGNCPEGSNPSLAAKQCTSLSFGTGFYAAVSYVHHPKRYADMNGRLIQGAGHYKPLPEGTVLLFGDLQLGYYGRIPSSKLINGNDLAALCTLTTGTPVYNDTEWFKFAYKGKTLFFSSRILRHTLSFTELESKGLIAGRTVTIGGKQYKVRVPSGGNFGGDPTVNDWDPLMYRICPTAPAPGGLQKWDNISADHINSADPGSTIKAATFCSNVYTYNTNNRVVRGNPGLENYNQVNQGDRYSLYGWRPVLELIG